MFFGSGWFLSCMVVYWFFFKPLAYLLKNITLLKTVPGQDISVNSAGKTKDSIWKHWV